MRSRITAAAVSMATVAASVGILLAGSAAHADTVPPWEPDSQAVGTITFYDSSGAVITSGSTSVAPFFGYAVGSSPVHAGDVQAQVLMATPTPGGNSDSWFRDQISGFSNYPVTSGPSNIQSLSTTNPVESGANTNRTIDQYVATAPNDSDHQSNASYQNLYQVRLVTADSNGAQTLKYDAADIMVDSAAHTWTQVDLHTQTADGSALTVGKAATIAYGKKITLSTKLTDSTAHKAIGSAPVKLYSKTGTAKSFVVAKSLNTSAGGTASVGLSPHSNTVYEWRYAGNSAHKAVTSKTQSVKVAQGVTLGAKPARVRHNVQFALFGTVTPSVAGQRVTLQHLVGRSWRGVGSAKLIKQKLPNGKKVVGYVLKVKESKKGTYTFRATKAGTAVNVAGTSGKVVVHVS